MLNVISFRHNSHIFDLEYYSYLLLYIILYANLSYLINALRNFNQFLFINLLSDVCNDDTKLLLHRALSYKSRFDVCSSV